MTVSTSSQNHSRIGILYDNISGNTGDLAIGVSLRNILSQEQIEFDELIPGRFNPRDYDTIIVGGGYLLYPSPTSFYDRFKIKGQHILNACGIYGRPDDLQYLDDYKYVSVRSIGDKKKLSYLNQKVNVVPCTSMLLKDLKGFDPQVRSPSIGIHLTSGILNQKGGAECLDFISRMGLNVYFVPINHHLQDSLYLDMLRPKMPGSRLMSTLRPEEIFTLIGKFDYFISMSLHGGIFAYAHNIPFILVDNEKTREFMQDRGLEQFLFRNPADIVQLLGMLMNDHPNYSKQLSIDHRILSEHVKVVQSLLPKGTTAVASGRASPESTEMLNPIRAIKTLNQLYLRRSDLQSSFPEVKKGNYLRLIQWAREDVINSNGKSQESMLTDHASWLIHNELVTLAELLSQSMSTVSRLTEEIATIKQSFGYKFMRCYATLIDGAVPKEGWRGDLRKVVAKIVRGVTKSTEVSKLT